MVAAVQRLLILPRYREPKTFCAGPGGSGTSTESRGSENMATCFVVVSMLTTIIVSVLNVFSCGRWSAPIRRMFRRPPAIGAAVGTGPADDALGLGVPTLRVGAADGDPATADPPGDGEGSSAEPQELVVASKMQASCCAWRS